MARPRREPPRLVEVRNTLQLSPNMLRVTFTGEALTNFPTDAASANIKLLLPHANQDDASYLDSLAGKGLKPIKRTYTVLEYRKHENELDIDVALHNCSGVATAFAVQAKTGDRIGIAGPGQTKLVYSNADWFLLAGDMSALPAIDTNLKQLPDNARGYVVIEVLHQDDIREFDLSSGMNVQYLINPFPEKGQSTLIDVVKSLPWLEGTPGVWVAGETTVVRQLRSYFAQEKQLDRRFRYTSGYWQIGQNEDGFQLVKRSEPDI